MTNAGKDDNTSQFLFTFGSTSKLQNKHTIFGKIIGETLYNMLKLEEALVDEGKSAHDHLNDPKLSSQPAVEPYGLANKKRKEGRSSDWESNDEIKSQEELEIMKKENEGNEGKDKKYIERYKKGTEESTEL
ncbi:Peptidyl-prolyl cis-trans isomerase CWC27 like protein [Eufriesea mexicana]|uniref:Peptidyl-prolyl cis-trans isomerase CWC27 like protein n=1 Tax=Eufriesea mexicana TaxID=516756 RepID=A0A310S9T2_9HYME|nr:Peptidyl-prolyl cis-trans isomerase CWC27 like protein [Eufriesea mexicana]